MLRARGLSEGASGTKGMVGLIPAWHWSSRPGGAIRSAHVFQDSSRSVPMHACMYTYTHVTSSVDYLSSHPHSSGISLNTAVPPIRVSFVRSCGAQTTCRLTLDPVHWEHLARPNLVIRIGCEQILMTVIRIVWATHIRNVSCDANVCHVNWAGGYRYDMFRLGA